MKSKTARYFTQDTCHTDLSLHISLVPIVQQNYRITITMTTVRTVSMSKRILAGDSN